MPIGKDLLERYQETMNGECDHKCEGCALYMKKENMCWYKLEDLHKEFARKRHEKFGKILKECE